MNKLTYQPRRFTLSLAIAAGLVISALAVSAAQTPTVFPVDSKPYGRTYAEWSAAFWQWMFALPVDGHPGTDSPDFDVTDGQSGRVWFLAGPFGVIERDITIPAGTSLCISLVNVDASSLETPPFHGDTAAEQEEIASAFADFITDLSFSVDEEAVSNIGDYRITSPQFTFTAPSPWLFGETGGTGTAVGVGYFVILPPLSKGTHTIHYTGAFKFSEAPEDYISVDMTYNVTVQ